MFGKMGRAQPTEVGVTLFPGKCGHMCSSVSQHADIRVVVSAGVLTILEEGRQVC